MFKLISRLERTRGYLYLNNKKYVCLIYLGDIIFLKYLELTQMKLLREKEKEMVREDTQDK